MGCYYYSSLNGSLFSRKSLSQLHLVRISALRTDLYLSTPIDSVIEIQVLDEDLKNLLAPIKPGNF